MTFGVFRDAHPRLTVTLPGIAGPLDVEFLVDTGFDGDLTLPPALARQLGPVPDGFDERLLADGSLHRCPFYVVGIADVEGASRRVEVLVLGIRPLLGTTFLAERLLTMEITEGGSVIVEAM